MAALDRYSGPFTLREASHLLRRACFGGSQADVKAAVENGLDATITQLFASVEPAEPPVNPDNGLVWLNRGPGYVQGRGENFYNQTTRSWWARRMVEQPITVREKLTLFWQNHFATEWTITANSTMNYWLHDYLRTNCLGNFKDMAREVTIQPAMLRYLNGNTNTVGNPNENYARELQELFTIGKGPAAGPGDYTYYTEQDVQAAARVLTGWRDSRTTWQTIFVPQWHDTGDKQFSARYNNRVIKGRTGENAGMDELNDLIDMIFEQQRTSEYIVEKLYRWFVDSIIDDTVRETIILPLAAQLRSDNFVVENVVRTLLSCEAFYNAEIIGAQLGSPADFVIGLMRKSTTWNAPEDVMLAHRFYSSLVEFMAALQMTLGDPPSVAGWEAYYQQPGYDQIWITTATFPLRNGLTDVALYPNRGNGGLALLDSLEFIKQLSNPADAFELIDELNEVFFAIPFTEATRLKLAEEVLMNGGRYYEWTLVWNAYLAEPTQTNTAAIKTFTDRLFRYLFRMAEFQLV